MSYSTKASAIREQMREYHQKRIRGQRIKLCIHLALLVLSAAVLLYVIRTEEIGEAAAWLSVVSFAGLPVFLLFALIHASRASGFRRRLRELDQESYECVVVDPTVKETTYTNYGQSLEPASTKDITKLTLKKPDGTMEKFKDDRVSRGAKILRDGDRVLYHPGFEYPIEPLDKTRGNICVFCGALNGPEEKACKRCKRALL